MLGRLPFALRWCGPPQRQAGQPVWHHAAWPPTSARGRTRGARCCGGLSLAWWSSWWPHLSSLLGTERSSAAHLYPLLWNLSHVKKTQTTPLRGLYQIFTLKTEDFFGGCLCVELDLYGKCQRYQGRGKLSEASKHEPHPGGWHVCACSRAWLVPRSAGLVCGIIHCK